MSQTITQGRLRIDANFKRFVDEEVLPGTGLDAAAFWRNFDEIVHDLAPENRQLLAERDRIQAALDEWHRSNPGPVKDKAAYKSFLRELGYLVPQPERVTVETTGIDSEITSQAGPQLVVPAMNARYALNAANARWGSLYDALYGSDIIPQEGAMVSGYDPQRGEQVIAWVRRFLDESLPLENGSYQDVVAFKVVDKQLRIQLKNGKETTLRTPAQFVGYRGDAAAPTCILLKNNGLHIELQHQLLNILTKVVHALFGLGLGKGQLRLGHTHLASSPAPIQDGERKRDAGIFLMHQMTVGATQVAPCLRKAKLHIEVGSQSTVGLGIGEITLTLLHNASVVFGVRAIQQSQLHGFGQWHFELRHAVGHH